MRTALNFILPFKPENRRGGIYLLQLVIVGMSFTHCDSGLSRSEIPKNVLAAQDTVEVHVGRNGNETAPANETDSLIHYLNSNIENFENTLMTQDGCFLISPGPGVHPVLEKMSSKEDFLAQTDFMFYYRDHAMVPLKITEVHDGFNPCAELEEGYYVWKVNGKASELQGIFHDDNSENNHFNRREIKLADKRILFLVWISFQSKHGDPITFRLGFSKINGNYKIELLDLSECGA